MTYHAIQRASQRYNITLTDKDGELFEHLIKTGDPHAIKLMGYDDGELWGIRSHHQWIPVIVSEGTIITVLPRRVLNPFRKILRKHKVLHQFKQEEQRSDAALGLNP